MLTFKFDHLQLRVAQPADEVFLKTLYASTRDDLLTTAPSDMYHLLIDLQWRAQRGAYQQSFPLADNLIVEDGDGPLGRLLVDRSLAPWRIVDIALLPRARGQGHGGTVLRALQQQAVGEGVGLALRVRIDNPRAHKLYAALGFMAAGGDEVSRQMEWRYPPA